MGILHMDEIDLHHFLKSKCLIDRKPTQTEVGMERAALQEFFAIMRVISYIYIYIILLTTKISTCVMKNKKLNWEKPIAKLEKPIIIKFLIPRCKKNEQVNKYWIKIIAHHSPCL